MQRDLDPGRVLSVKTVEPRRPDFRYALAEIWRYRRFSLYFGRRFVRKRYMATWLGLARPS